MRYEVYRTPGGGHAVEASYDLPATPASLPSDNKAEAAAIRAKAAWQSEQGYGRNEDERAMLRKAFAAAKELSLADEDCLGRSGDDLTA